jgi:putative ABC transport system permease protein
MIQGPSFKRSIPEIESFVRTRSENFILRHDRETFQQAGVWVDEGFFNIFSFNLLQGNPSGVLADPHSVVLTDETAKKYFGGTDVIGKTIELEVQKKFETFTVTGIAKRAPENSSIRFQMLLPFKYFEKLSPDNGWLFLSYSTYLLLHPNADVHSVETKMKKVYESEAALQLTEAAKHGFAATFIWGLEPITKIHLDAGINEWGISHASKPIYAYILNGIALFILLIACINFVNLNIAQSLKRAKEIGLRKVVGGSRRQLIRQFMGESFVLCFFSFLLAIGLAAAFLPLFNEMTNEELNMSYLFDPPLLLAFLVLFLLTSLAAGFYPALVLSGFNPVETLYHRITQTGKKQGLVKGLTVFQFALATFLIISTFIVYSQYDYLTHAPLGYNDKDLLSVSLRSGGSDSLARLFKIEFSRLPGVKRVGATMAGRWGTIAKVEGKDLDVEYRRIDENYIDAMGLKITRGRNFSPNFPSDSIASLIVNEEFVRQAGWKDPIGKTVENIGGNQTKARVVGVIDNYHYTSMKEKLNPQIFTVNPKMSSLGSFLVRLDPGQIPGTLKQIEQIYRTLYPWHPFDHTFVEEENRSYYENEARWRKIMASGAVLTIFISCIGLLGLTLLSTRKRTKEIGIRKVLGARIWQIAYLVSKEFLFLVLLACILAIPGAWYAASRWLDDFPYRILLNGQVFIMACLFTISIAVLTVTIQVLKTARANPVSSLRTE